LRRGNLLAPIASGAVAASIYMATTSTTITYGGDCGELVAAAHTLGIAHPPGYPLYILLLHLLDRLLPGEPALAGNLFSCLSGGLAVGLLCSASQVLGAPPFPSFVAALSFGLSHLFWGQAVIAEVYPFNVALFGLLLLSSALAALRADLRWLCLAFLSVGLGMAHHLSLVPLSLPLLLWSLLSCLKRRGLRAFLAFPFALSGLPLYLYLPLRAGAEVAWADTSTLRGLASYFTLYSGHFFSLPAGEVVRRFGIGLGLLPLQFLALTLPGLRGLFLLRGGARVALLATIAITFGLFSNYDVGDLYNFFLPAYAAFVPFVAAGLTSRVSPKATVAASLVGAGLVAYQAGVVGPLVSVRGNTRARDYAVLVLSSLPRGAAVLPGCDEVAFSMLYVQHALGLRRDVEVRPCPPAGDLRLRRPEEALGEGRPVFVLFFEEGLFSRHKVEAHWFGWRLLTGGPLLPRGRGLLGEALSLDISDRKAKRGECIPGRVRGGGCPGWALVVGVLRGAEEKVASGRVAERRGFSLGPAGLFFAYVTPIGSGGNVPLWLPDGLLPGVYKIGAVRVLGNPFDSLRAAREAPSEVLRRVGRWAEVEVSAI